MVAYGVPAIVQYIETNEDPQTLCTQLGLCSSSKINIIEEVVNNKAPQQDACSLCELAISYIEGWLAQNATVQQIEQALEKLCNLIPQLAATCDAIVEQGLPQIIAWIEQNQTPTQVCTELGLCSSTKYIPRPNLNKPQMKISINRG